MSLIQILIGFLYAAASNHLEAQSVFVRKTAASNSSINNALFSKLNFICLNNNRVI